MRVPVAVLYVVLVLFWGSTFLWIEIATPDASPLLITSLRLLVGAATVAACVALMGPETRRAHAPRALRPWLARGIPLGLLAAGIPGLLLAFAQRDVSSGTAAILNATAPLWTAGIALVGVGGTARDRLPAVGLVGLLVGLVGVGVLMGEAPAGTLGGSALVLLMALVYSSGGVLASQAFAGAPPYAAALMTTGATGAIMLPLGIVGWLADPPGAGALLAIVALGATSTGVAYLVYFELIRRLGPTRTLTVTYLQPLVAISLGVALLGEALHAPQLLGLALILLGVAVANGGVGLSLLRRLRGRLPARSAPGTA